jgi:RNA polymerase-associated protein
MANQTVTGNALASWGKAPAGRSHQDPHGPDPVLGARRDREPPRPPDPRGQGRVLRPGDGRPGREPEDLAELNPTQSLPTLVDRDLVLYDVNVIGEYLDERYPHPPLMPVDPLSRARIRLGIARIQRDWYPFAAQIHNGAKAQAETARKRLREQLLLSVPVFKAAKFFLNPELSLADCALAPLIWRLPSLAVSLPREAQPISEYGERIFRNPGYTRSLSEDEKLLRAG